MLHFIVFVVIAMFISGTLTGYLSESVIPKAVGANGFAFIVIGVLDWLGFVDYFKLLESGSLMSTFILVGSFVLPIMLYMAVLIPLSDKRVVQEI